MRTLKLHFPDDALSTLDTFVKQTKEARVFRRAQAVRNVVKGQRLQTVSDALQFTYSALRKWVHRFANQGTAGLVDRPRPVVPPNSPVSEKNISIVWSSKTLLSMARSTRNGVAANSRPCSLPKLASSSVAKVSVVP
jgi:hypothetical protein